MRKRWIKILMIILFVFAAGCGSGRKLAKNPQPLGFVPFSGQNMAGDPEELNHQLEIALRNSGSFYLQVLDSVPSQWDLPAMQAQKDSSVRWIVTGQFEYENISTSKGKNLPFLLYKPNTSLSVRISYRLYSSEKKGWQNIGEIDAGKKKGGDYQVLGYDEADPSLALDAKERQLLHKAAYEEAAQILIGRIEKQMKIK